MQRPKGFDRPPAPAEPPKGGRAARASRTPRSAAESDAAPAERAASGPARPAERRPEKPVDPVKAAQQRVRDLERAQLAAAKAERRSAAKELRRATKERRRYEKAEIRRFTARSRARRAALLTTLAVIGALVVLGLVAIFSPILALRTIVVQGTSRVDAGAVQDALDDQLGTPLALISGKRIDEALAAFPVIQSYATEMVPPGTMVVDIVERQPVVTVAKPGGGYLFVDAAGVTVEESGDRIDGVPLVTDSSTDIPNETFDDAVEVLLALPDAVRQQVDTITAKSHDDVTLTLVGGKQQVEWGSADDSDRKAELLGVLQQLHKDERGTFDVSAIDDGIFRAE